MPESSTPLLLDFDAAAEALNLPRGQIERLVRRRAIPARRVGRLIRFDLGELRAWSACGCPTEEGAADRVLGGEGARHEA